MREYTYHDQKPSHTAAYLWPTIERVLLSECPDNDRRVFEIGCGNGAFAARLEELGFSITGIDSSETGIEQSSHAHPNLRLAVGSAYEDLAGQYGTFPVVVSLEVVEHLYDPRRFARNAYQLLIPGGVAVISTPYHGYLKNLLLAVSGKMDGHFTALWDHGHIKFWSQKTLRALLREAGFGAVQFKFAGRVPVLAKSMIAIARK